MLNAYIELQDRHSGMAGLIVAARPEISNYLRKKIKVFPTGLHMITGQADVAMQWADLALAVSGTVSLDLARHRTPMVGMYKTGWGSWMLSKILLRTKYRLLPNIIAEEEIVPEFIPHPGGSMPIVEAASLLIRDSRNLAIQRDSLSAVLGRFSGKRPGAEAAKAIAKLMAGGSGA